MSPLRRLLAALLCTAPALVAAAPAASAADTPATCDGVWVVVDSTAAGGSVAVRCATDHSTGSAALAGAGFAVAHSSDGLLCQIDALPATCASSASGFWGYWQATATPGGFGTWAFAMEGPDTSHPAAGNVEGWVFGDGSAPPSALPPTTAGTSPTTPAAAPVSAHPEAPAATLTAESPAPAAAATTGGGTSSRLPAIIVVALVVVAGIAARTLRGRRG